MAIILTARMKAMQASSEQEDTLSALAGQVLFEEQPAEEQHQMRAEKKLIVRQAPLKDAIAGIPGLIVDTVIALVTPQGQNGVKRADIHLQAMLQGLMHRTLHERLNYVKFEDCLLPEVKEATPARRQVRKVMEAVSEDQDFIAWVSKIIKKKIKKAVNAGSEREDRRRKIVEAA